jgi:hypothetical protein
MTTTVLQPERAWQQNTQKMGERLPDVMKRSGGMPARKAGFWRF